MRITDLLASNGYILYNSALARELGTNEAILIGEFAKEFNYWNSTEQTDDGWFFSTIENVEYSTGLTGRQQRPAIEHLVELGLIETENRGIPCRRYFRINENNILHLVEYRSDKMSKQGATKGSRNNSKNNSNKNNSIYKRPTLDEVNQYIKEKGLSVDASKFFDYFEAGDWIDSQGKRVRNWKQKLLTWDRKDDTRARSNSQGEWNRTDNNSGQTTSYDRRNRNGNSDPESIRKSVEAIESAFKVEIDYSAL